MERKSFVKQRSEAPEGPPRAGASRPLGAKRAAGLKPALCCFAAGRTAPGGRQPAPQEALLVPKPSAYTLPFSASGTEALDLGGGRQGRGSRSAGQKGGRRRHPKAVSPLGLRRGRRGCPRAAPRHGGR